MSLSRSTRRPSRTMEPSIKRNLIEEPAVAQMRFSGGFGGAENVALSLSRALRSRATRSYSYFVLERRAKDENLRDLRRIIQERGVQCRIFETDRRFSYRLLKRLARSLKEDRVQILHAHCYKSAFYGILIRRFFPGTLSKVVLTLHGLFEPLTLKTLHVHLANLLDLYLVDRLVCCSRELFDRYRKYPFLASRMEVIQNGLIVDSRHKVERLRMVKERMRTKMASLYGLDREATWIASIGRLTEQKNFPLFLETAKYLKERYGHYNLQFLVVGDGPLKDELRRLSRDLEIEDRVFFTSHVADMDMVFSAIDMVVVTSLWEGTPMCVLEAMAYGRPVVATAVGGIPDLIRDGITGCLVHSFRPNLIGERIVEIVKDQNLQNLMKWRAYFTLKRHYSHTAWASKHVDFYRRLNP